MMKNNLPQVDMPQDLLVAVVGVDIPQEILGIYRYPCRIKAGIFVFCQQGSIEASINMKEHHIRENDFIIILPGTIIEFHKLHGNLCVYLAGFSSRFIEEVDLLKLTQNHLSAILENPILSLRTGVSDLYKDYFELLRKAYSRHCLANKELVKSVLLTLLNGVACLYQEKQETTGITSRSEDISKQLLRLVMKHYTKERNVAFYASLLNISPQHLCATIRKVTEKTVSDIIAEVVIMDAKAQLKSTDLTIQEISTALNFPNVSFFGKYFKRHVGVSPQKYRNS